VEGGGLKHKRYQWILNPRDNPTPGDIPRKLPPGENLKTGTNSTPYPNRPTRRRYFKTDTNPYSWPCSTRGYLWVYLGVSPGHRGF